MDYNRRRNKKNNNKKFLDARENRDFRNNKEFRDNRENNNEIAESVDSKETMHHSENKENSKGFKSNCLICPRCNLPITELTTALADKDSGEPVHFDCVLEYLQSTEKLLPNQKITYIGQGRFAIAYFPNIHDIRNFSLVKIIEWEPRDKTYEWRTKIAQMYSQVK